MGREEQIEASEEFYDALRSLGLENWRCPERVVTFSRNEPVHRNSPECGALPGGLTQEISATRLKAVTDHGKLMLTFGVDPGAPDAIIVPVAYNITVTCTEGHEHFIKTMLVEEKRFGKR